MYCRQDCLYWSHEHCLSVMSTTVVLVAVVSVGSSVSSSVGSTPVHTTQHLSGLCKINERLNNTYVVHHLTLHSCRKDPYPGNISVTILGRVERVVSMSQITTNTCRHVLYCRQDCLYWSQEHCLSVMSTTVVLVAVVSVDSSVNIYAGSTPVHTTQNLSGLCKIK